MNTGRGVVGRRVKVSGYAGEFTVRAVPLPGEWAYIVVKGRLRVRASRGAFRFVRGNYESRVTAC